LGLTQKGIASKLEKVGLKNFVRGIVPKSIEKRVPMGVIEGKGKSILDLIQTGGINWKETKAIALPGGIYLNTVDRPNGIIRDRERSSIRDEISNKMKNIKDPRDGSRLKVDILFREEIYSGEYIEDAPDIQFIIGDYEWGEIRNIPSDERLFDTLSTAHHDENGVFIASGNGFKSGVTIENASIMDLAPTILAKFGIKAPEDMDGRVLSEIFATEPTYLSDSKEIKTSVLEEDKNVYTPEEEKAIEERLRGLGYVD